MSDGILYGTLFSAMDCVCNTPNTGEPTFIADVPKNLIALAIPIPPALIHAALALLLSGIGFFGFLEWRRERF